MKDWWSSVPQPEGRSAENEAQYGPADLVAIIKVHQLQGEISVQKTSKVPKLPGHRPRPLCRCTWKLPKKRRAAQHSDLIWITKRYRKIAAHDFRLSANLCVICFCQKNWMSSTPDHRPHFLHNPLISLASEARRLWRELYERIFLSRFVDSSTTMRCCIMPSNYRDARYHFSNSAQ